jgi:hypothetical protein
VITISEFTLVKLPPREPSEMMSYLFHSFDENSIHCRIVVALDNAVVAQIRLRQCGGFVHARSKGFGRLWLVLHRLFECNSDLIVL